MNDIIIRLKDKDDKAAYEYAKKIGAESAESDKYLDMISEFAELLADKSSYVRTRGFCLICNQAKWASDGQIDAVFDRMSTLLYDEKPTVVRQCLKALQEVALYRPEMSDKVSQVVDDITPGKYKDSMSPLIDKDRKNLLKVLGKT